MAPSDKPSDDDSQPETIIFDDSGDLWLIVGKSSAALQVDSHALCRASKVFRTMLRGRFLESKPTEGQDRWEVKFPEDKSKPFIILMDMAHGNFDRTPLQISSQALYDLCVLTNKYDMTKVLRPMTTTWYKRLKAMREYVLEIDISSKMLFVAWELGCYNVAGEIIYEIAQGCSFNRNNELVHEGSTPLDTMEPFQLLPVLDQITQHRSSMLDIYHAEGHRISDRILARRPICLHDGPCSSKELPSDIPDKFVQAVRDLGIKSFFPLACNVNVAEHQYRGSIRKLQKRFDKVNSRVFGSDSSPHPHWCSIRSPLITISGDCFLRVGDFLSTQQLHKLFDRAEEIGMTTFIDSRHKTTLEDDDDIEEDLDLFE